MGNLLATLIIVTAQVLSLLIIAGVLLSYILSPYHPVRETLDRILEPLYAPIRRILPRTGMIDFSPLVLLILIQIIETLLVNILR